MARCCKNLGHFGAENSAVKGYIAMMPLFQRTSEYVSHPPWLPGSSQKDKRSYQLQKSLQELVDTIMKEKSVFSLVFSTWQVRDYSLTRDCATVCSVSLLSSSSGLYRNEIGSCLLSSVLFSVMSATLPTLDLFCLGENGKKMLVLDAQINCGSPGENSCFADMQAATVH